MTHDELRRNPSRAEIIVLNDQGGAVMSVSYDLVGTLRAEDHGHPPLIYDARGNGDGIYLGSKKL